MPVLVTMNVFRQDAFSALTLTEQVNKAPYVPNFLGSLGVFEDMPILTTSLEVDERDGVLGLIQTTPRGAPPSQRRNTGRLARIFKTSRIAIDDVVYAEQVQNVRAENEQMALQTVQEEVARRVSGPDGLLMQREFTLEYHRLGAIQGLLLDADGSVIYNFYNEFNITPPAEFVLNLDAPVVSGTGAGIVQPGTLTQQFNQIVRAMKRAGRGAFVEGRTEVHALTGDDFFDALITHPDVRDTYKYWSAAADLRRGTAFDDFRYGGIVWHNYRGTDDNETIAVPTNKAKFFPVRAPGVFKVAWAPGEGMADVNTYGKPMYLYPDYDPSTEQAWVKFTLKSFPLHICTRPEMLQTATMDAVAD